MKGNQGRSSIRTRGRKWSRGYGGILLFHGFLQGLLRFLILLRTTCPVVPPPLGSCALPYQPQSRKCSTDFPESSLVEATFQVRFLLSQCLQPVSKQANEQAISPTTAIAKQCWWNALLSRCGGTPLKFYHLESFGGEVMNLGKPGVLTRTLSQRERDNVYNLNNWSDPRVTIQSDSQNAYLDFLEFSISFFIPHPQATQWDAVGCVSILLLQSSDPHIIDFRGDATPHHAIVRGNTTIASNLLEYNAIIEAKTR